MRVPPAFLPLPSFRRVDDELSRKPTTAIDTLARSFGYRDGEDFDRPPYYIRHTEPLDSELMNQVEYDMDEQDHDWLQLLNGERKKEGVDPVSPEVFEVIMDQLEKEWFTLMKRVPKPDMDLPAEDSSCAVCDDGEGENSNAIVFCDGCNLAVHQDCYGVPYIPEGQWLCRKCTVSPEVPVACLLCPNEGGAFKQTSGGKWAHLLCAIWIPEVTVQNPTFMEPIEHIENISKSRWKLKCTLCKDTKGACIQCDVKSCYSAFHVTCARKQKFLCSMKLMPDQEEQPLRAFCEKHLPRDLQESRDAYFKDLEERADEIARIRKSSKAARAYARTYKTGPPLVPQYIVDRVMNYIVKVQLRKKIQVVLCICKYWSLKREARRGAPLLKRLHLEPWTTATSAAQQTETDRLKKLEYLKRLRQDLIHLRDLTTLIRNRETTKKEQTINAVEVLSTMLFPHEYSLRDALSKVSDMDIKDRFRSLQSKSEIPEYYEKISRPMCWVMIDDKLDSHQYWDPAVFIADVELVLDNAISYYPSDHELHRLAVRLKRQAQPVLSSIRNLPCQGSGGPLAAFEPALGAIKALWDTGDSWSQNQTLLSTLLSSLGDPNRALVEAIVKTQDGIVTLLSEKQLAPASAGTLAAGSPESTRKEQKVPTSPLRADVKPPKPPRDRKAEKERRAARLAAAEEAAAVILPEGSTRRRNVPKELITAVQEISNPVGPQRTRVTRANKNKAAETEEPAKPDIQQIFIANDAVSSNGGGRKRKRNEYEAPVLIPNVVVDDVSNQATFKQLETGRILTEGSRRIKRGTPTPSNATTERPKEAAQFTSKAGGSRTTRQSAAAEIPTEEKKSIKPDKEKPSRQKRAEERQEALVEQQQVEGGGDAAVNSDGMASSDLTDIDGEDEQNVEEQLQVPDQRTPKQRRLGRPRQKDPKHNESSNQDLPDNKKDESKSRSKGKSIAEILGDPPPLNEKGIIDGGTLVWAKQPGHPWFPGVVFESDDDSIPKDIMATYDWFCQEAKLDKEEMKQVQVVRFWDKNMCWAWLHPKSIRLMFDNTELDDYLLKYQRHNSKKGSRKEILAAYNRANHEREEEGHQEKNEITDNETLSSLDDEEDMKGVVHAVAANANK